MAGGSAARLKLLLELGSASSKFLGLRGARREVDAAG